MLQTLHSASTAPGAETHPAVRAIAPASRHNPCTAAQIDKTKTRRMAFHWPNAKLLIEAKEKKTFRAAAKK